MWTVINNDAGRARTLVSQDRAAFYGDDFTGGSANLANFQRAGLDAVMFLRTPSEAHIDRHAASAEVLGIAGVARSLSPKAMAEEIEPAFRLFASLQIPIVQYKVCSTFDSGPELGNLVEVMAVARRSLLHAGSVPVVPACPASGRFTLFSNHFARQAGEVYRIDRHPVMSVHPSTPMREGDLRRHLEAQGTVSVGSVSLDEMRAGDADIERSFAAQVAADRDAVIFDGLADEDVAAAARLIHKLSRARPVFAIAAQDFALQLGALLASKTRPAMAAPQALEDVDRMLVLSGSASAINGGQIWSALANGWAGVELDASALLSEASRYDAIRKVVAQVDSYLREGRCVVVFTATSADDPMVLKASAAAKSGNATAGEVAGHIGRAFGEIGSAMVKRQGLRRLVFAGGDTSSHAMPGCPCHPGRGSAPIGWCYLQTLIRHT